MGAVPGPGLPQQHYSLHAHRLGGANDRRGAGGHPQFDLADLRLSADGAVTRHEAVTGRKLFGVAAGLLGTCLIVGVQALAGVGHALWAQLTIVAATICYAGAAIFGKSSLASIRWCRRRVRSSAARRSSFPQASSPTGRGPWRPPWGRCWRSSPFRSFRPPLPSSSISGCADARLGRTSAQAYMRVPIGVAIGVFFLGEQLTPTAWLGLACVIAGVAAMTIPARPKPRRNPVASPPTVRGTAPISDTPDNRTSSGRNGPCGG